MYTAENYLWGLVAYYLGAVLVLFCCWYFRRWIGWRPVRHLLLVLISVVLLLPFNAYPDMDYLAPAWFISLFEGITKSTDEGYLRAGVPLIVACLVGIICYATGSTIWFFQNRKKGSEKRMSTDPLEENESREENSGNAP